MRQAPSEHVVVVGAGIGGLSAGIALAAKGIRVTIVERAVSPGGKMRQVEADDSLIDSGPTVFTMRWVFDELFAQAGCSFGDAVTLQPLAVLARHAWNEESTLDLFADEDRSVDAIGDFAGRAEAARYRTFCNDTRRIYDILEKPFLRASEPSMAALLSANGFRGLFRLPQIKPFSSMWSALSNYFHDSRLRQLFGRYATYCGSSPFEAPATLMLVAHVEREGVWSVEGGMQALARALADRATALGVAIRYACEAREILIEQGRACGIALDGGERIDADALIVNADVAAVAAGLFGDPARQATPTQPRQTRSLSAMTWSIKATADGFPLHRHNVFFSGDYKREFDDIFRRGAVPSEPTVYVCAHDRDGGTRAPGEAERLLVLINAPPTGDLEPFDANEVERCEQRTFATLKRCGLTIAPQAMHVTTPKDFNALFPGTGGALYGRSSHGWTASFQRPGARTKVPGLYLAGGSTHPGPGVPMAALSGRAAAACLVADLTSASRSRRAAMPGGTSMR